MAAAFFDADIVFAFSNQECTASAIQLTKSSAKNSTL
jgi:hypothetical protein